MTVVVGVPDADARVEPIREAARLAAGLDEPLHVVHVRAEGSFEEFDGEDGTPTFGAIRDAAAEIAATAFERAFEGTSSRDVATDGKGTSDERTNDERTDDRSTNGEEADDGSDGTPPAADHVEQIEHIEHVGLVGDPAETLIEHAAHADASLIVVGGNRRSPVGKAVFGDVTQDILYESACPVVTCLAADD